MLEDYRESDPVFGVVLIQSGAEVGAIPRISSIGTTARLESMDARPDGTLTIAVIGVRRFAIQDVDWSGAYGTANVGDVEGPAATRDEARPLLAETGAMFNRFVAGVASLYGRRFRTWTEPEDPVSAVYDLASRLPLHTWERQAILEDPDPLRQLREVNRLVRRELALLKAGTGGRAINHPGSLFTSN